MSIVDEILFLNRTSMHDRHIEIQQRMRAKKKTVANAAAYNRNLRQINLD